MARRSATSTTKDRTFSQISDGMGASDDSSGGGNATGTPDADTAMRPGGNPSGGNVEEDRKKLFPEQDMAKKKLRSRVTEKDSRQKQNAAGSNRGKTRNDVPSTPANKAASGKQKSNTGPK